MKNIFKIVLSASIILGLWSCKKDENRVIFKGGTPPVLLSSVTGEIPMSYATQSATAFSLNWTNPEYQFNTGVNSLDVNYNIVLDKTASFNSGDMKTLSVGTDLSKTFTQAEFDDILLNQLSLDSGTNYPIYIRVDAFFVGGAKLLSSNTLTVSATPYAIPPKVTPPASGNLYIVGNATPGGWPPLSNDPNIQKFTKITATLYTLTININGNGEYKLVEIPGQWDKQWSVKTEPASGAPETLSGELYFNGGNGRAPLQNGTYKITVDFQKGTYTFIKQ